MKKCGLLPGIQELGIGQMALGRLTWMGFIRALLPPGILSMASPRSIQLPPTLTGSRSSPGTQHNSSSLMLQVMHCFAMWNGNPQCGYAGSLSRIDCNAMSQLLPIISHVAQLHKQHSEFDWKSSLLVYHCHLDTMCKVNTAGQHCFCSCALTFPFATRFVGRPSAPPLATPGNCRHPPGVSLWAHSGPLD